MITLSFLFHFNQNFTPYARLADAVCYWGLLRELLDRKSPDFTFHFSGTLIEAMKFYAAPTLTLIKKGYKDRRFELLGSTYSQNVMYSTDERSNKWQLQWHKKLLADEFGVNPKGFWMAERCWKSSLVNLISKYEYKYSFVETHILKDSGSKHLHLLHCLAALGGKEFFLVPDDPEFRILTNIGIWTGDFSMVKKYLRKLEKRYRGADAIALYAEDAEASGLWGYHKGVAPQQCFESWGKLLNELGKDYPIKTVSGWIKTVKPTGGNMNFYTGLQKNIVRLKSIANGQAGWMVESARRSNAPYHEDGYRDWFDFNRRSPKLIKYRKIFLDVGKKIEMSEKKIRKKMGNEPPHNRGALSLIEYAKKILISHQYEFGCIGIGDVNYPPFEGAKKSLAVLKVAEKGKCLCRLLVNSFQTVKLFKVKNSRMKPELKFRKIKTKREDVWFYNWLTPERIKKLPSEIIEYRLVDNIENKG
ncbi:MAG: hypothetical protein AB1633_01985 [Elusimicrobiota bacterium]